MVVSDELFLLISLLKQSEKRYFKIYSSNHVKGKKNNYVRLFEAIEKQDVYDEKALLEQFKGEVFTKQFSVTKNYLYNFILKSLRSYYSGQDISSRINNDLESVKILYDKGLYKKSIKILKKVKEVARTYEKYEQLLNILDWEGEIMLRHLNVEKLKVYRAKARQESAEIIAIIQNKNQLRLLSDQAYDLYRNYMIARSNEQLDKYASILEHELLQSPDKALSFQAKWSYNNIHGIYYTTQEDYEKACLYDELQLELLEQYPHIKSADLTKYIKLLNNLLDDYLGLKRYDAFLTTLQVMRQIPIQYSSQITHSQEGLIFETAYELELSYYLSSVQFEKGIACVPAIEKNLKKFENSILVEFRTSILFAVSKLYFYTGQLEKASDWVRRIVFDDKPSPADDLLCFARLLNLLIHYELDNHVYLYSEIKTTKRFLAKKKRLYEVEKAILKYLGKLINIRHQNNKRSLYIQFKEVLKQIIDKPFEQHAVSYLNIIHWLNAKIEKKDIAEIMREQKKLEE